MPKQPVKKEWKEPDQFLTTSSLIFAWSKKHRRLVGLVTLSVLLLLAALTLYWYVAQRREQQAAQLYEKAAGLFRRPENPGNLKAAKELYRLLVERYPRSGKKRAAYLYMGLSEFGEGRYGEAIAQFQKAIKPDISGDRINALAYKGLGYAFEAAGQCEKALGAYQQLTAGYQPTVVLEEVYVAMARCYEKQNNPQQARSFYLLIRQRFPNSPLNDLYAQKIAKGVPAPPPPQP